MLKQFFAYLDTDIFEFSSAIIEQEEEGRPAESLGVSLFGEPVDCFYIYCFFLL